MVLLFAAVASLLGKVHRKAVAAARSDEPRVGFGRVSQGRGFLWRANVFRRSLYSAIGILAGTLT